MARLLRHGTRSCYTHDRCRCQACREANAAYQLTLKERLAAKRFGEIPHGRGGYENYGCRCETCFAAKSEANREYRERAEAAEPAP